MESLDHRLTRQNCRHGKSNRSRGSQTWKNKNYVNVQNKVLGIVVRKVTYKED